MIEAEKVKILRKELEQKPTQKLRKIYDGKSPWWSTWSVLSAEAVVAIHEILVERGEIVADLPNEIKSASEAGTVPIRERDQSFSDDPISPSEMREFMRNMDRAHVEQLRVLSAIRWAIIGFSIWFAIQFWFLPKILSSVR